MSKQSVFFICSQSFYRITSLLITLTLIQQSIQMTSGEEDAKRSSHNIMRIGRTSGHNIMRFGRAAGHNIMHFGKRDSEIPALNSPLAEYESNNNNNNDPDNDGLYEYQPMLYSPYRGRLFYKKADRDNVFMHFG